MVVSKHAEFKRVQKWQKFNQKSYQQKVITSLADFSIVTYYGENLL
jgi:hypothetical protein